MGRNERAFGSEENARDISQLLAAVANGTGSSSGLANSERVFVEEVRRKIARNYR